MRVTKNINSILLEFSPEENEVVDWIYATGATKFREMIEMYIKQRGDNMRAAKRRDIVQGIESMTDSDRAEVMLDITVNRRDR